jgi:hypothetical protein
VSAVSEADLAGKRLKPRAPSRKGPEPLGHSAASRSAHHHNPSALASSAAAPA